MICLRLLKERTRVSPVIVSLILKIKTSKIRIKLLWCFRIILYSNLRWLVERLTRFCKKNEDLTFRFYLESKKEQENGKL